MAQNKKLAIGLQVPDRAKPRDRKAGANGTPPTTSKPRASDGGQTQPLIPTPPQRQMPHAGDNGGSEHNNASRDDPEDCSKCRRSNRVHLNQEEFLQGSPDDNRGDYRSFWRQ